MLVKQNLTKNTDFYPYLYSGAGEKGFLADSFYTSFKNATNNIINNTSIRLDRGGQENRINITIRDGNKNLAKLRKLKHPLAQLFELLNSEETRLFLYEKFKANLMENGFIGKPISAFFESSLELQYCEASASYENPFHVDTRKRVVHGLLYMGNENLQGGNLVLAKHKPLKKSEYPQIPDLDDLSDHRTIEPLDNTGLLILSTPNSYHKGQCSIGRRRFCYWGYNYMDNKNCWISGPSWDKPLKFKEAVQLQNAKLKSSNAINKNNFAKDSSANEYDELMINHSSSDEQIISELEE